MFEKQSVSGRCSVYFHTSILFLAENLVSRASVRLKTIRCLVDVLWVRTDPAKGSAELHPGILSMKVLISYFHPFKLFILSYFHISFFRLAVPCNVLVSKKKR